MSGDLIKVDQVAKCGTSTEIVARNEGVGRIQRVPLREVWKHEALDFTRWLQENTDVLNDVTGLALQNVEREQSAGAFNVDLVAEDAAGNTVIIENQLGRSDHDHLGKLITYVSALEAKTAVWIVAEPQPEHIQAVNWLNGSSSVSFYLLRIEAVQIDDSRPAPLLSLITGPSDVTDRSRDIKLKVVEQHEAYRRFWTQLLAHASTRTPLHGTISPGNGGWIAVSAGVSGLILSYVIRRRDAQVELYFKGDAARNKAAFDRLIAERDAIERAFGGPLIWERLDEKRPCRIAAIVDSGGLQDEANWPVVQQAMVDTMIRFEAALRSPLSRLSG